MKLILLAIASLLGSCAAEAATTTVPTPSQPPPAILVEEEPTAPIPRRCNALASMQCEGHACDPSEAWTSRTLQRDRGRVSYYADAFQGRHTANGDRYDRDALTAASRDLPFGTILRIRRVDRPTEIVIVRVNDRGPFGRRTRILDLSRAAAQCIDMIRSGVVEVDAEVIRWGTRGSRRR